MAGIKHNFVSTVSDEGDTSLVRPSNWNAEHTIDDASIAESKLLLTDVSTSNASTTAHGLLPKLSNDTGTFLRGDGSWGQIGYGSIVFGWNNGTNEIIASDQEILLPYSGTIESWTILADKSASVSIDLWLDSYANYPPTVDDTICGANYISLVSAIKNTDSTLTSWNKSFSSGSIMLAHIISVSDASRIVLIINYKKG